MQVGTCTEGWSTSRLTKHKARVVGSRHVLYIKRWSRDEGKWPSLNAQVPLRSWQYHAQTGVFVHRTSWPAASSSPLDVSACGNSIEEHTQDKPHEW